MSNTMVDSAGEPQASLFQQFSLDTSPQSALAVPPPLALGLSLKSFLRLATHQPAERERLRVRQQSHGPSWYRARRLPGAVDATRGETRAPLCPGHGWAGASGAYPTPAV